MSKIGHQIRGFTLIETCVALIIFLSVVSLSSYQFNDTRDALLAGQFFQNFEREVKIQQQRAMILGKTTAIQYSNRSFLFMEGNTAKHMPLPKNVSLLVTTFVEFRFKGWTGNTNTTMTLPFSWSEGGKIKRVTYTFKFGSGNFEKHVP